MIAALHGDLDTSDTEGKVFFREDGSPDMLRRAAEHINRAFPDDQNVNPTHVVVISWVDVARKEPESTGDSIDKKVRLILLSCERYKMCGCFEMGLGS